MQGVNQIKNFAPTTFEKKIGIMNTNVLKLEEKIKCN
jgi:hypothetical protein